MNIIHAINSIIISVILMACSQGGSDIEDGGAPLDQDSELETYIRDGLNPPLQAASGEIGEAVLEIKADDSADSADALNYSNTNLQEANVDEGDWFKTDGYFIYRLKQEVNYNYTPVPPVEDEVSIEPVVDSVALTCVWPLPQKTIIEVFQLNNTLASSGSVYQLDLGEEFRAEQMFLAAATAQHPDRLILLASNELRIFDRSNPSVELIELARIELDSYITDSRLVDNKLYLVSQFSPSIVGINNFPVSTAEVEVNTALIQGVAIEDLLPSLVIDQQPPYALLGINDCEVPETIVRGEQPQLNIVTTFSLDNLHQHQSHCIANPVNLMYMSTDNVYLAYDNYLDNTATIHRIRLNDLSYQGQAVPQGQLLGNRFRLSEYDNHLRIVSSLDDEHFLDIYALDDNRLDLVSSLPNATDNKKIGKADERIESVRFAGDRAYVVTFLRTDPFYVLDLADVENPIIAGELMLPGFSDYLHPINADWVLGFGRGGPDQRTNNVKVSLFNVQNISAPTEAGQLLIGDEDGYSHSILSYDHKALTVLKDEQGSYRFAFPVGGRFADAYSDKLALLSLKNDVVSNGFELSLHDLMQASKNNAYASGSRGIMVNEDVYYLHGDTLNHQSR